jgi:hypothetical protein
MRFALVLAISWALPEIASAQGSTPKPADRPSTPAASPPPAVQVDGAARADQQVDALPIDVGHIKEEIKKQPAVRLDDQQLRFYVLVLAKAPKFQDFVGDYDLKNGPTRGGAAMTHQEFLNMVTPKELNELFGSTSGSSFAMFQAAIMNAVGQSLIKKAILDIRGARDEREVQAIRERIDRELSALLGKN